MRKNRLLITLAAISVVALSTSMLMAAEPKGDDPLATPGGDEDLASLSIDEMSERGSGLVRRMEKQLAESFKLLEESIAAGDVAATTARNEAITAMKGLVKLSEQNLLTLQQRAAERDRQRVEHEYVKITIAAAKVGEFYAQIKSATGIPIDLELTDVERKLEFQGQLPVVDDLVTNFETPPDVPEPPVHASPYF
ncbi:MAG: hypothetical protein H6745_18160 [Deltaproteobacteria bacterium]|nr:hypothetical protein [Deltaproteobacteria bacterium]